MTQKYIFIHLNLYLRLGTQNFLEEEFNSAIEDIKKRYPDKTILLFDIFEHTSYLEESHLNLLLKVQDIMEAFQHPYYFVLDTHINTHLHHHINNLLELDWSMMITYYFTVIVGHPALQKPNPDSHKALYLMGKGEKFHRIGILKMFYESNNLDKLHWSFKNPNSVVKIIREKFFKYYDDEHFTDFLRTCTREIDSQLDPGAVVEGSSFSGLGFPYDISVYEQTGFSIISESWVNLPYHFITEKTWRTIANSHPFVLVAQRHNFEWLSNNGYETFTRYFPIPNYYDTYDQTFLIEGVVANALYMNRELSTNRSFYDELLTHSQQNKIKFYKTAKQQIINFLSELNQDKEFLLHIIRFHNQFQLYDKNLDHH